jgi:hypothetical protein
MTRKPVRVALIAVLEPMPVPESQVADAAALGSLAEQFCAYFTTQLTRFRDARPEPADLMVVVQVKCGDEHGSWQYRDGRFVLPDEPADVSS